MTKDEAIRLLDPETTASTIAEIECYNGFSGRKAAIHAIYDACVIAVEAIRAQIRIEGKKLIDVDKYVDELNPILENMKEENPECAEVQIMEYCIGVADTQERVQ